MTHGRNDIMFFGVGIAFAIALFCSANAEERSNEVNFLFSSDNQISGTAQQYNNDIKSKSIIRDDKWINAPLTRLDYVLIKIESTLTRSEDYILHYSSDFGYF